MKYIQHDDSIYDGVESLGLPDDRQGFPSSIHPIFEKLIKELQPLSVVEIGSHKGISVSVMASLAGPECQFICVDTWLGGLDQQKRDNPTVTRVRGFPTTYLQFLANIKRNGFHKQVTPVPTTSHIASQMLKADGVWADLVYIDGSHLGDDCLRDLEDYWPILRPGGICLVDDFQMGGVHAAVLWFADKMGMWNDINLTSDNQFAYFRKP